MLNREQGFIFFIFYDKSDLCQNSKDLYFTITLKIILPNIHTSINIQVRIQNYVEHLRWST